MKLFWPVIPHDWPLGYVFTPSLGPDDKLNGHQMYVKCKWPGLPGCTYEPGFLDDQWELGCFRIGCEDERTSVVSGADLLDSLKKGLIIGTYRDGLVVTAGSLV